MSSSLSFLLSLSFVVLMMAYAGDLCRVQTCYAELDMIAISAGKMISRRWSITSAVIDLVESAGAHIYSLNREGYLPAEGDPFRFRVAMDYRPLAFHDGTKTIFVNRSVVLGYRG